NTYTKMFDNNLKKEFLKLSVYHKEECKNCWAKYYCCGGCSSKNYQHNKNLKTPYKLSCEIQKKKIECAIAYNVLSRN
ncbi:MAG: SPASM domain-containing protein, partial [Clostridia bacterium]|nr:SPASM domain-containing protein [Clostridia bacterium]